MGYSSNLSNADKGWLEFQINELIDNSPDMEVGVSQISHRLITELRHQEEFGDESATRILSDLASDGIKSHVARVLKGDRSKIKLKNGAVVDVPSRVGVRAVNEIGQRQAFFQQPLWWELSWTRIIEVIDGIEGQRDRLSVEITAYREILRLRERFPQSNTPMEACELAGIDPREFGNSSEQVA